MSHVAKVDVEITNLDDLEAACKRIGLELVRGQQTYEWYGSSVGDTPLLDGFTEEELGTCDHAIRVPEDHPIHQIYERPYEIGVCKRRDGKAGFALLWDYFAGGFGLWEHLGTNRTPDLNENDGWKYDGQMPKLKQAYAICAAQRVAAQRGFRIQEQTQQDGSVRMFLTK